MKPINDTYRFTTSISVSSTGFDFLPFNFSFEYKNIFFWFWFWCFIVTTNATYSNSINVFRLLFWFWLPTFIYFGFRIGFECRRYRICPITYIFSLNTGIYFFPVWMLRFNRYRTPVSALQNIIVEKNCFL